MCVCHTMGYYYWEMHCVILLFNHVCVCVRARERERKLVHEHSPAGHTHLGKAPACSRQVPLFKQYTVSPPPALRMVAMAAPCPWHSRTSSWQRWPVHSTEHTHRYDPAVLTHWPPLSHGEAAADDAADATAPSVHSLMSDSQVTPLHPGAHRHVKPVTVNTSRKGRLCYHSPSTNYFPWMTRRNI